MFWFNIANRTVRGLLGGITLLALFSGAIEFAPAIERIIDALRFVSHSFWQFAIGWFFDLMGWHFPDLLKDYFSVGILVVFASIQSGYVTIISKNKHAENTTLKGFATTQLDRLPAIFFAWPLVVLNAVSVVAMPWLRAKFESRNGEPLYGRLLDDSHVFGSVDFNNDRVSAAAERLRAYESELGHKYGKMNDIHGLYLREQIQIMRDKWNEGERSKWRGLVAKYRSEQNLQTREAVRVFFDFLFGALFLLCFSYGLLFSS